MIMVKIVIALYQTQWFLDSGDTADYDNDDHEDDNNSCHTVLTNN